MFLRNFVIKSLKSAIGNMPDYWVLNNALGWYDKGVLPEYDLADIQAAIDAQYPQMDEPADGGLEENMIVEK